MLTFDMSETRNLVRKFFFIINTKMYFRFRAKIKQYNISICIKRVNEMRIITKHNLKADLINQDEVHVDSWSSGHFAAMLGRMQ